MINLTQAYLDTFTLGSSPVGVIGPQFAQSPPIYQDLANNKTSILVQSQLPDFVQNNYPNFIAFIEAYYEYLEQNNQLTTRSKNFPNLLDVDYIVDNNLTDFIELFRRQYLASIPTNVLANKGLLIKHIKQFYSSRGTPKSFKFLFRILFNEDVDIFNTGDQILIASGGQWLQPSVLRIQTSNTLTAFTATQITGQTSGASAMVDTVNINFSNGLEYNEITLNNISGAFLPNETITSQTLSGNTLYGVVSGSISAIVVTNGGSLYNIGDPVLISANGGASAVVSKVSVGGLESLNIINGGAGFQPNPVFAIGVQGGVVAPIAQITVVDTSGTVTPNNYIFCDTLIVPSTNVSPKSTIGQSLNYFQYANCGPIQIITISSPGVGVSPTSSVTVNQAEPIGNSGIFVENLGSIGQFEVINGGVNYSVGDDVKITNITARGAGSGARVSKVSANGSILNVLPDLPSITGTVSTTNGSNVVIGTGTRFTVELTANNDVNFPGTGSYVTINSHMVQVTSITNNTVMTVNTTFTQNTTNKFVRMMGFPVGGIGYLTSDFPSGVSVNVISATGSGANVAPVCIVGDGSDIIPTANSQYGSIENITLTSFGSTYVTAPTIDLTQSGNGQATAVADFVGGIFQYPGYFLNEDGMLSSRRYMQDAVQYNNYSYMLRSPVAVNLYQQVIDNLLSPVGTNMVGMVTVQPNGNEISVCSNTGITLKAQPPDYDFNFIRSNTLNPNITFTRSSNATYINSSGILQTVANNTPRFSYNPLPNNVNYTTNSSCLGAVPGTPGTWPTNWDFLGNTPALQSSIVDSGIENGIPYIDVRIFGVYESGSFQVRFDQPTNPIALFGQTWCGSFYYKVVAAVANPGDSTMSVSSRQLANDNNTLVGTGFVSSGVNISTGNTGPLSKGRIFWTGTNDATNCTFIFNRLLVFFNTVGGYYDITLRIGGPQLEYGVSTPGPFVATIGEFGAGTPTQVGMLVEETRTNMMLQSASVGINTPWLNRSSPTFVSGFNAPDGSNTAVKMIPTAHTSGLYDAYQNIPNATSGTTYTFSIYVKPANYPYIHAQIWDFATANGGGVECWASLSGPGAIIAMDTAGTATGVTASIKQSANGWYRIILSGTPSVGSTATSIEANVRADDTGHDNGMVSPDGVNGYLLWGAQFEQGSYATSYIPTTTATYNRRGETVAVSNNIIDNAQTLALEAEWLNIPNAGAHNLWTISDGTSNNEIILYNQVGQNSAFLIVNSSGVNQISGLGATITPNTFFNHATTWTSNGTFTVAANGSIIGSSQAGTSPIGLNRLNIGTDPFGNSQVDAHIRRVRYWNTALPSNYLQTATTQYA